MKIIDTLEHIAKIAEVDLLAAIDNVDNLHDERRQLMERIEAADRDLASAKTYAADASRLYINAKNEGRGHGDSV